MRRIGSRDGYNGIPYVLSEESVHNLAKHYFTVEEICDIFNVHQESLLERYGQAFHAGKADALMKPRMLRRDCAILLQGFIDGYKELVADGSKLHSPEAADVRKIYEVMAKAESLRSSNKILDQISNPLSQLSDEELQLKLAEAGYIKQKNV